MPYVYILANKPRTIYVGLTNDLARRLAEHRAGVTPGSFVSRYGLHRLVYVEEFDELRPAVAREWQIKAWTRAKRVALIESQNPTWEDLSARPGA